MEKVGTQAFGAETDDYCYRDPTFTVVLLKVRESGMPEEERWETFFDVPAVLSAMEVNSSVTDLAEFGCGYGTFTIPAAKIVSGKVFALDIESALVEKVIRRGQNAGLNNIVGLVRDFIRDSTGLANNGVDYVMLFNIIHDEQPSRILRESFRILRPGGKVGITHWNYDPNTPRGPPMEIRPRPEQCREWAAEAGFEFIDLHDLKHITTGFSS